MSQAVFLMAGPGIGKSTLTEAITERLSQEMIIVQIHGSSSLSGVPYGVLAPYTAELTAEDSVSSVAVLRSVWRYFEKLKAGKDTPLLLMMDDAHHLDEATASIVADMISAGWATVLAAGRPRPGLPQPLAQLWYDGLADRVDLRPMNREQVEEVLSHALDGTIPSGTIDTIWSASGGNPRILDALLHDAAERGELAKRNGIWMLLGPLPADGPRLAEVVVKDMLRRSPEEQEVLKLVALAGPVSRKVIEDTFGAELVRTLLDQQMMVESPGIPADLRIWNSVFGEALRTSISVSRSLQLLEKIRDQLETAPEGSEGRMRAVEWALECGLKISDPELLEAAGTALVHSRNRSSRMMAAKVADPDLVPQAQAVQGRALFNEGDFAGAAKLLDGCWLQLGNGAWAVPVLMLRAMAHQALGTPLSVFVADSREALQGAGATTAGPDAVPPDSQETAGAPAGPWQERLLRLLELCEAGNHQPWRPRSRNFGAAAPAMPRTTPCVRWAWRCWPIRSPRPDGPSRGWMPHCWPSRNFPHCRVACSSSMNLSLAAWWQITWPWGSGTLRNGSWRTMVPGSRGVSPISAAALRCSVATRSCGRGGWNAPTKRCCRRWRP
ncbi:hypothetical protein AHiyo4_14420 [Arthrobacter sp. Hiyo4]|nr:hypothetical protein AHiyo4_14420 [Arthrobacter sp. Hiyo4]